MSAPRPMSRRKAGCMPRRVDPEPAAHTDDETEMGDLVIDVKPEQHPWPLQAAGLPRGSPKEVPARGRLQGAPRSCPTLVPAAGTLLSLGVQNQSAPSTSLVPDPQDSQPCTDKHPDTLTCGLRLQTVPLKAIAAFMDHKQQGCPPSRGPSPGRDSELENLKALTCLRCGRQFTKAWTLLRHAQGDHGLSIYQMESEAPETPLLGLAEVAAAMSAAVGQGTEAKGSGANSLPRGSPTCPVCMKTLSSFSSLKGHVRSHTDERPYACDQCPYACAQCPYACAQSSRLNRHKKTPAAAASEPRHGQGQPGTGLSCPSGASRRAAAPARTLLCSREGAGAADTAAVQEPGAPGGRAQAGPGGDSWGDAIKEERMNSAQIPEKLPKKTPKSVGSAVGPGAAVSSVGNVSPTAAT